MGIPSLPKSSKQPRGTSFLKPPGSVSWQLGIYSLHSLNYPKSNSLPLKNDGWKTNHKIFSIFGNPILRGDVLKSFPKKGN